MERAARGAIRGCGPTAGTTTTAPPCRGRRAPRGRAARRAPAEPEPRAARSRRRASGRSRSRCRSRAARTAPGRTPCRSRAAPARRDRPIARMAARRARRRGDGRAGAARRGASCRRCRRTRGSGGPAAPRPRRRGRLARRAHRSTGEGSPCPRRRAAPGVADGDSSFPRTLRPSTKAYVPNRRIATKGRRCRSRDSGAAERRRRHDGVWSPPIPSRPMARVLIVGCGCRGQALARALVAGGHAVRGTPRDESRLAGIEAAGAEALLADPDRLATMIDAIASVSVVCWLMGTAVGAEQLHGPRLESMLEHIVDTPVRGFVYETGRVERAEGIAAARRAAATYNMPVEILDADPAQHDAWTAAARAAVGRVLMA